MKLFLLRYMDIMTGYTGHMKVRADTEQAAIDLLESKYENFEVIEGELS